MLRKLSLLMMLVVMAGMSAFAQSNQRTLTLEEVKVMAKAAEDRARQDNWNVVIAIVDGGGHLLFLQRMDGAQIASIEVAQKKAKAAIFYKRPTKVFEDGLKAGNQGLMLLPDVIASEGGVPIIHDGQVIGAIGVSGVTSAQDGIIATAGVDVLQ
ncbi:MAG TPA: heme-binding protein [Cyclobacteriaceae bacterium]|nr:heme-binding protein [Cyclobacteriaceae bacterium]